MSRLRAGLDYSRVKKAEKALWTLLQRHRGKYVDLPAAKPEAVASGAPDYLAVAAQNLVNRSHGAITIQRFQSNLTLCYRGDFEGVVSNEANASLQRSGFLAVPGDDPTAAYDPNEVWSGKRKGSKGST